MENVLKMMFYIVSVDYIVVMQSTNHCVFYGFISPGSCPLPSPSYRTKIL